MVLKFHGEGETGGASRGTSSLIVNATHGGESS
jgi:hypothetical protein